MTTRVAIAYNFNDRDWMGGRNYFASLLRAAGQAMLPGEYRFVLVCGTKTVTDLPQAFPDLEVIRTPLMDRKTLPWLLRQMDVRLLDNDRLLARLLRQQRIDILSHSMPIGPGSGIRTIAWLYDFQFLHLPHLWQRRHIRWARRWYSTAARVCDALIVSSKSALADLEGFVPLGRATRHVLPFVSNPVDVEALASPEDLARRYDIPTLYFYLPNQFWANKNHALAVEALARLKQRGVDATIVCTGKTADGRQPDYFASLMHRCRELGVDDRFRVLGLLPYEDTQALMLHSRAVINPSLFEGWSTTVEEAKTLHKDLILSDIPVHREQAPARGSFFPADDPVRLADLLEQALKTPEVHVSAGNICRDHERRSREFGERYIQILRTVVHGN